MRSRFLADLQARELLAGATSVEDLDAHLADGERTMYVGFDPTADSLHVGSLLPLLALRRAQLAGHRPIVLVGGGTGLIGDPAGKAGERQLNPREQVAAWAERLKAQVRPFLDFEPGPHAAIVVDNYEWLAPLDVITFLRDVGKHFGVGAMIARESVRARMGRADAGISYTEFSYQVLQAFDFLELERRYGCTVQLGGSDQWGNITAGTELIRRVRGVTAFGITLPLVTRTDGSKFGKTETGTVWLDAARTSPYEMYQFWLNTADADVVRFLRYFTFLGLDEIEDLARRTAAAPEAREAQRRLARDVTSLVHGPAAVAEAERITEALFSGDVARLSEAQLEAAFHGAPRTRISRRDLGALPVAELLVRTGLAESRRAARELLSAGAVHLNGRRVAGASTQVSSQDLLFGRYLALRKGKKSYHLVTLAEEDGDRA
ncbi:MAG TPA: tyrosine--tRNA ligase [Candidatus Tectomicrobia bacterium]|nr:tyrosine--tRNA ligase [Candidatus Tectomicrobia bacterium]